tara:strand:+ start:1439 stop:1609 length:171 start_codon:yes stop_codon:yes gene_type:complete
MAKYSVIFTGCVEVEDASSEESAIAYVRNYIIDSGILEYEAEKVKDDEEAEDELIL